MNKQITLGAVFAGLAVGTAIALYTGEQPNQHYTSNTIAHIHIEQPGDLFSTSLPLRFELILNENNTYGVYAMLPQSQVGYSGTGQYDKSHNEILFMYQNHTPLDLPNANSSGVIEQLFVRPGSFDGLMQLIDIGDKGAILVGNKVALHLRS